MIKGLNLINDPVLKKNISDFLQESLNLSPIQPCVINLMRSTVFSKPMFTVEYHKQKYVLRVVQEPSALVRDREITAMSIGSQFNISPCLKSHSSDNCHVLMRYIANDIDNLNFLDLQLVYSLATMLKGIHSMAEKNFNAPLPDRNKFLSILLDKIEELANDHPHLNLYRKIVSQINYLEELLSPYKKKVCHYDLHPWNLLIDNVEKKIYAVDWESVGIGDELYDVATAAMYLRLNKAQEKEMLFCYYGGDYKLSKNFKYRYLLNKIQSYLFYSLGFIFVCTDHDLKYQVQQQSFPPFYLYNKLLSEIFLIDIPPKMQYEISYRMFNTAFMLMSSKKYQEAIEFITNDNLAVYPRYNKIYHISLLNSSDCSVLDQLRDRVAKDSKHKAICVYYSFLRTLVQKNMGNNVYNLFLALVGVNILDQLYRFPTDKRHLNKIANKQLILFFKPRIINTISKMNYSHVEEKNEIEIKDKVLKH